MCEEILTAREFLDFARKDKAVRKSQSLWWMQTYQYMLDITDSARLQAFRDCGVTEVIWHTEEDERVCDECYPRDGQIFSIDDIPPKPHRNCRCWLEPKI